MKKPPHQLGDAPIEDKHYDVMNGLARGIDEILNGKEAILHMEERKTGFVLMVFPFEGFDGRCNYISNGADRRDIITLMKSQIARFEGQPETEGHA